MSEPSREELSDACAELVHLWHTREAINPDREVERYHDARLLTVSALAAHAYRTGEVGDHLIAEGLWLESAPVVRLSFECSVTAIWTALVPDGTEAILNEDYRSKRTMANTLKRTDWWDAADPTAPDPQDNDHETFSAAQARNFLQMCDDLVPGGAQTYSLYRVMCLFGHPTNYVVNRYAETTPDIDGYERLKLRRTPRPSGDKAYLFQFVCAMSMVTAASALNYLDAEKKHETQIAEIAERVGVSAEMRLTKKARTRVRSTDG